MAIKDIASILFALGQAVHDQINDALEKAYERGLADGRRMAAEELSARVVSVLNISAEATVIRKETTVLAARSDKTTARSPRGSVAPAVLDALRDTIKGKKPAEIAAEKGIPENSVRGILNKLRHEGAVEKRGELWFPAKQGGNHNFDPNKIFSPPLPQGVAK
jgi:hypothetical protein